MASSATAAPQVNGASPMPCPNSPSSIQSSTKRKRSESQDSTTAPHTSEANKAVINGTHKPRDQKTLIRDYLDILRKYDTDVAVLKHPLPESCPTDEPQAKRQKSEETTTSTTIEDKVQNDEYNALEDLVSDITLVVKSQLTKPKPAESGSEPVVSEEMTAKLIELKDKAHELYRREYAYPQLSASLPVNTLPTGEHDSKEPVSLVIYSNISTGRKPLLTSLQQRHTIQSKREGATTSITDANLPNGIYLTQATPGLSANERPNRSPTLGELFPSPRNLPPLQPHKPTKSTIKNNVLTFYHPELTNQSKFRSGTYFSQNLSMGQWLDYSNATPSSHIKTKQRQRAQSLAGHKPSSTELEMSEMEALFRGAFSSFAPCKDDTAAMISSGQLSHMYWQQWGRRNLQRMIESDTPADEDADGAANIAVDIDEGLIQEAIDNWDDAAVDPTLSQVMGKRSDQDKEVDDLLEEVSDLIETLASYQRNRNLTLPTSQDRHSTDPPNGDMLRNGSLSHQPTEEEVMTYEMLKSQLCMIIKTLPPFAVARINSDKLEELNVSTKIQVGTNEYSGVMEEDEPAIRARQMAAQVSGSGQRASHRTPSASAGTPYANHQFNNAQYAGRTPMPNTPHFPQTPSRSQSNMYPRSASGVPIPPQSHQVQARPSPQQPYRTPSGYGGLAPQLAKSQTPYGHSNMPQYAGNVPGQARMQHPQGYPNMAQGTPNTRYAPGYPPTGYQQQQQMHPQQHAQQRQYQQYMNGASQIPPRTMSPQVSGQPHAYSQSPTPSQQQPHQQINRAAYGTPTPQGMPPNVRQYNSASPGMPQQAQQQAVQYAGQHPGQHPGNRSVGITGYHTVMGDAQQQQVLEQARQQAQARHDAQARTIGYGAKVPQSEIAGLAGIGLSGNVDIQKLAAARANMTAIGHNSSMSPSPKPSVQPVRSPMSGAVNGTIAPSPQPPPAASPLPLQGSASPAPVGGVNHSA